VKNVVWKDGMTVTSEHLKMQNQLSWDRQVQIRRWNGVLPGIWSSAYDVELFRQGFISWVHLELCDGEDCLCLGEHGHIIPKILDLPKAELGGPDTLSLVLLRQSEKSEFTIWQGNREVLLEDTIWEQRAITGEPDQGTEVIRFQRKGDQWVPDRNFMPALMKMGDNVHGEIWLDRVHVWIQTQGRNLKLTKEQRKMVQLLQWRYPSWQERPIREVWSELLFAISELYPDDFQNPPWHYKRVSKILEHILELLEQSKEEKGNKEVLLVPLKRSSQFVYSAKLISNDWNGIEPYLRWYRNRPFEGTEIATIRVACLSNLSRFVRAQVPGIPLKVEGVLNNRSNSFGIQFKIDNRSSEWLEILLQGFIGVHSPLSNDEDEFWIGELA